ncbi:hypothetical protein V5799_003768 [Amblyomma americanum]|uniref:Tnf receptor-associated factor n=1 Tax=Amblyomma americanum TaxID=6943 RepID=A0AAQ4D814_AMBAM
MATRCVQYTLVGFSAELDWRSLCFVKPLPRNRVCSACGLVRRTTVLLPCGHTLCECCYGQCEQDGLHVCALDSYECQDEDVEWRDLSDEELLKREVKCWNQQSGCQYVTTISGIAEHFQSECQHHTLCCPKCSASVLFREIIAHLKSGVCDPLKPPASDCRDESVRDESVFFTYFREELSVQAREIKECMDRFVGDIKAHGLGIPPVNMP